MGTTTKGLRSLTAVAATLSLGMGLAACGTSSAAKAQQHSALSVKKDSATTTTAKGAATVPTTTVPPITTAPPTTQATFSVAPFVGSWYTHGGGLTINADGSGTLRWQDFSTTPASYPALSIHVVATGPTSAVATVISGTPGYVADGGTLNLALEAPGIVITDPAHYMADQYCDQPHAAQSVCGA